MVILTADEACKISIIAKEKNIENEKKQYMDIIQTYALNGCKFCRVNRPVYGETCKFLKELGYKLSGTDYKYCIISWSKIG